MSEQKPLFTAEELGDTLGARRKFTVRMLLMTALVAGVITVVVVGNSIATAVVAKSEAEEEPAELPQGARA